jgi:hypothetical protein
MYLLLQAIGSVPAHHERDRSQTVYHVTCALKLVTDLLVDLATFFHPPASYPSLFVLTAPEAVSRVIPPNERVQTEGALPFCKRSSFLDPFCLLASNAEAGSCVPHHVGTMMAFARCRGFSTPFPLEAPPFADIRGKLGG